MSVDQSSAEPTPYSSAWQDSGALVNIYPWNAALLAPLIFVSPGWYLLYDQKRNLVQVIRDAAPCVQPAMNE
jgi:hypothetical protein